jgi:hypothetical protein
MRRGAFPGCLLSIALRTGQQNECRRKTGNGLAAEWEYVNHRFFSRQLRMIVRTSEQSLFKGNAAVFNFNLKSRSFIMMILYIQKNAGEVRLPLPLL